LRDLLFLTHRIPYPPNKGDKIRSFHLLRHLASRFNVHLGCFFDDASDEPQIIRLREFCAEVFCLPLTRTRKLARGIGGLMSGRSISEACYRDARMEQWTRRALEQYDIRDIFVFCSVMAPYVFEHATDARRVIIDMIDVDSEKWRAYSRSGSLLMRPLFSYEQRHVLALEKRAAAAGDWILFVSQAERDAFAALAPESSARLLALENGVDSDRFDPAERRPNPFSLNASAVVFTGAMDYRANIDAVVWFAREVFPDVRHLHPDAGFWIVGSNPSARVRRLSRHPGVRITGAVDDVRDYLAHAKCVIAPLRIARGVQNKVLEAMAMAKPVVLTPAALEGLHAEHGRDVLVADNRRDFARCVSDILSGGCNQLGPAARRYVERHHSWAEHLKTLDGYFPATVDLPELVRNA
jgi:sugar transferase (PEP-CTERM/EpsH1 system associated)